MALVERSRLDRVRPARAAACLVGDPKSDAGKREISPPDTLVTELKRHRKAQAAEQLRAGNSWRGEGWVFATPMGAATDPRRDWGAWRDVLDAAGVRRVRLHDARHTVATQMLLDHHDPVVVMALMGWSQPSMLRNYQHVVPDLRRAVAATMERAVFGQARKAN